MAAGGASTLAPNGRSPGSVTMGDGQGSLAELLIATWPRNRANGNDAAGAGEGAACAVGNFFPTLTGGPSPRGEGDRWAGSAWGLGGSGAKD
jgi:hypothetical protein